MVLYSAKAAKHKSIYPYLRYGFVVIGVEALGRPFLIHNDFAMAVPNVAAIPIGLLPLVRRQIKSAQRLASLAGCGRIQLRRYEENVEIDA